MVNKKSLLKKDSHRLGIGKLFEHNYQKKFELSKSSGL